MAEKRKHKKHKKHVFKTVKDRETLVDTLAVMLFLNNCGTTKSHLARKCGITLNSLYNKIYNRSYKGFTAAEEKVLQDELHLSDNDFNRLFRCPDVERILNILGGTTDAESYRASFFAANVERQINTNNREGE